MDGVQFLKGHGAENDFVLLPDFEGVLELTPARVRALCDRRRGLGADGVLRVVRTAAVWDLSAPMPADAEWFMDYRNADGSIAEMCGNGVRVFARYLAEAGLIAHESAITVATRGGARRVRFGSDNQISVDMGAVRLGSASAATLSGRRYAGVSVDVGNPHLACVIETPLDELDLTVRPGFDRELFPDGVNIEFVTPARGSAGRTSSAPAEVVSMRVYERGVGETRSCGTGMVAAAAAVLRHRGQADGALVVRALGGQAQVELASGMATLTGPAVLVAAGRLDDRWWR
ncbi:MAG: diaminopimelate epimerase, partial [Pseudonocardia sp.]|nr:diaminopimelate epimerase [Pseudonocardia sp.]